MASRAARGTPGPHRLSPRDSAPSEDGPRVAAATHPSLYCVRANPRFQLPTSRLRPKSHRFPRVGRPGAAQDTTPGSRCPLVCVRNPWKCSAGDPGKAFLRAKPAATPALLQDSPPSRDEPPELLPHHSTGSRVCHTSGPPRRQSTSSRPRPRRPDHSPAIQTTPLSAKPRLSGQAPPPATFHFVD